VNSGSANCYSVAGLSIRSEIVLPELVSIGYQHAEPDVEIQLGPVPTRLPGASSSHGEAEVTDDEVLLNIPGVARFHISGGCQIRIEAETDAEAKDVRVFLLGSALGAIYLQRGFFPLHASVVVMHGNAIAFSGDSGTGKSTMAAWMNQQGYPLLCDDVCVVRFDENEKPMAYAGFPRLKLWRDTLEACHIDAQPLQRDHFRADKYHLPVVGKFCNDPVPLRHINILQFAESDPVPRITDINPTQAVHLLRDNTYRYQYISGLGLTRKHFLDCVKVAKSTRMHILSRPQQFEALPACQAMIEKQIR